MQVEVVGGLVEQQDVWRDEERAGEGDTHAPSARERGRRLELHLGGEAQTREDGSSAARGRLRIDLVKSFDHLVQPRLAVGEGGAEQAWTPWSATRRGTRGRVARDQATPQG